MRLRRLGQSLWLDFVSHELIHSGRLKQYIGEGGLGGVTSNLAAFAKTIAARHDYEEAIRSLTRQGHRADAIWESIVIEDMKHAADVFRSVYDQTGGRDGYVSLDLSPHLARDTLATLREARRLWAEIRRPNVMVKVPATPEAVPAIRQLISDGISVHVTFLFGLSRYRQVAEAYLAGLEALAARKHPLEGTVSVASFFLSRIDAWIDAKLKPIAQSGSGDGAGAGELFGQAAIASAKVAYQLYQETCGGARFRKLARRGARPQRLLWASTRTNHPAVNDLNYVEALIGPETVHALPLVTLDAYRAHGSPACRLTRNVEQAHLVLAQLSRLGMDLGQAAQRLEEEGIAKSVKVFDNLLATVDRRSASALRPSHKRPLAGKENE